MERPGYCQERKKYYSGKKKIHTLKNQFIVLPGGEDIVDISIGQLAKISDIILLRKNCQNLDAKQRFLLDKAYIKGEFITTPYKNPKKLNFQRFKKKKIRNSPQEELVLKISYMSKPLE
jgi:phosphopentomutase